MAHQFLVNQTISSSNFHLSFWNLLQTLLLAGWTKTKDSDGTTYSSSGTQLTTSGQLANNAAWFVVRDPAGLREFCVQHDNAGNTSQWRVKYSKSARFTGGSPSGTRVPSATDEQIIFGGGTDASPTFGQLQNATPYQQHIMCCDSTLGYSFYSLEMAGGATTVNSFFMFDSLQQCSAQDNDAAATYLARSSNALNNYKAFTPANNVTDGPNAYFGSTSMPTSTGGGMWKGAGFPVWNATIYPGVGGTSSWGGGKDAQPVPVAYARYFGSTAQPTGHKGWSTLLRYPATVSTNLTTHSTTSGTSKDWIHINNFLVMWPDSTNAPSNSPGNTTAEAAISPTHLDTIEVTAVGSIDPIFVAAPPTRNPVPHYFLQALDNNGVIQKWVDTAINMVNAPTVVAGYAETTPRVISVF